MRKKDVRNSIIEMCPIRNVVARFGNKWALLVVLVLNENGNVRFNALSRMIPDISPRVLSGTLKTLEADGLVRRTVHPKVPPKVEYSLTQTGLSLVAIGSEGHDGVHCKYLALAFLGLAAGGQAQHHAQAQNYKNNTVYGVDSLHV